MRIEGERHNGHVTLPALWHSRLPDEQHTGLLRGMILFQMFVTSAARRNAILERTSTTPGYRQNVVDSKLLGIASVFKELTICILVIVLTNVAVPHVDRLFRELDFLFLDVVSNEIQQTNDQRSGKFEDNSVLGYTGMNEPAFVCFDDFDFTPDVEADSIP